MRLLLDECVPRPLRRELPGHEIKTVQELGWSGTRNGPLLKLIKGMSFDAFVTTDQRLEYQQNLEAAGVAVVVLVAKSNKLRALLPLVPELHEALARVRPGDVVRVGG
jgi:hypothetical protein